MSPVTDRDPEPASPRPRRIATPSWLDARLVLGVLLLIGSVFAGAAIVSSARHTYPTVTARHDLAAGTILTAADVGVAQVQLPGRGAGVYPSRIEDVVGKQLSRDVSTGELVPVAALRVLPAQTTVTVPLEYAAAPDLRQGQRIELWVSTPTCSSLVLLPDVTVQAVREDVGAFGSGTGGQDVVISVPPDLADRVIQALAVDGVRLRAGVLVGPGSERGAAAGSPLPDLTGCASGGR